MIMFNGVSVHVLLKNGKIFDEEIDGICVTKKINEYLRIIEHTNLPVGLISTTMVDKREDLHVYLDHQNDAWIAISVDTWIVLLSYLLYAHWIKNSYDVDHQKLLNILHKIDDESYGNLEALICRYNADPKIILADLHTFIEEFDTSKINTNDDICKLKEKMDQLFSNLDNPIYDVLCDAIIKIIYPSNVGDDKVLKLKWIKLMCVAVDISPNEIKDKFDIWNMLWYDYLGTNLYNHGRECMFDVIPTTKILSPILHSISCVK